MRDASLPQHGNKFRESLDYLDFPLDLPHDLAGIRNKVVARDHWANNRIMRLRS